MTRALVIGTLTAAVVVAGIAAAAAQPRAKAEPAYYASIGAGQARLRRGPGRTYQADWLYVRADLPVRVIASYKEWRQIEDPSGTKGWMLGNLVSRTRTAIVTGGIVDLRERAAGGARVLWRAEPGVVGRIGQCGGGWCRLDVKGRAGFVETIHLWGVDPGETVP